MPGPKSDKEWSDALRRAVKRESDGKGSPKWLDVIANRVVEAAAEGDAQAFKEIGDRLDGKPKQETDNNVNLKGTLNITKEFVRPGS